MHDAPDRARSSERRSAALVVLPFVALGLLDVILLLFWGLDPLWGFVILPPILFISAIAWIAFSEGFHEQGDDREVVNQ